MTEFKPILKKTNINILVISVFLVVIGFFLMSGGGSDDPNIFSEEIFSTKRIVIAPIFVIGGFALVILGIMKK